MKHLFIYIIYEIHSVSANHIIDKCYTETTGKEYSNHHTSTLDVRTEVQLYLNFIEDNVSDVYVGDAIANDVIYCFRISSGSFCFIEMLDQQSTRVKIRDSTTSMWTLYYR